LDFINITKLINIIHFYINIKIWCIYYHKFSNISTLELRDVEYPLHEITFDATKISNTGQNLETKLFLPKSDKKNIETNTNNYNWNIHKRRLEAKMPITILYIYWLEDQISKKSCKFQNLKELDKI